MPPFHDLVTTPEQLTELLGTPSELAVKKQLLELDRFMIDFIARSKFVLLGTSNREGRCDVSPRGEPGSAASVLDSKTLVIAERKGNRRADSLRNILETGRVGLLFMVPGSIETLRVNGRAQLILDPEVLAPLAVDGQVPILAIGVDVEECFFQCGKALIRSQLWGCDGSTTTPGLPCFAEILVEETKISGQTVEKLTEMIDDSYKNRLY